MPPLVPPIAKESLAAEAAVALPAFSRLMAALPDFLLALLFAYPAINLVSQYGFEAWIAARIPGWAGGIDSQMLSLIVGLEVVMLWPQLTLVDVATRVLKRPNPWLTAVVAIIGAAWALNIFEIHLEDLNKAHFFAVAVPILLAVWQRAQMLWTLPGKLLLDRRRVRATIGGRFTIALALAVPLAAYELAVALLAFGTGSDWGSSTLHDWHPVPYIVATLYFLLAAFDQWRVGGAAFAKRPRPFLGWDFIDVTRTDSSF